MKGREIRRRMHRLEDNIRMDLKETEWEFMDWMHVTYADQHGNKFSSSVKRRGISSLGE
jgi:hypothetical protein